MNKWIWTGLLSLLCVFVVVPQVAAQGKKCKTGTKRCGPICIPDADPCRVKTYDHKNWPTKGTKAWKEQRSSPKPLKQPTPKGVTTPKDQVTAKTSTKPESQLDRCSKHADLKLFQQANLEHNLKTRGWLLSPAQTQKTDRFELLLVNVDKKGKKASVGIFQYQSSGHAQVFALDAQAFSNTAVVRSPDGKRVVVSVVEGGTRADAQALLDTSISCIPK